MDNSIEKKRIEGEEDLISTIKVATAALLLSSQLQKNYLSNMDLSTIAYLLVSGTKLDD